jgi:hypothetical protein
MPRSSRGSSRRAIQDMGSIEPELLDWKRPIRNLHCASKALQLLPGIDQIQGLRAAKPWNGKRSSA